MRRGSVLHRGYLQFLGCLGHLGWILAAVVGCNHAADPPRNVADAEAGGAADGGAADGGAADARQGTAPDAGSHDGGHPAASSTAPPVRLLRLRVPTVLPCQDFAALRVDTRGEDVLEWWQPDATGVLPTTPTLRLDLHEAELPLPRGFVPRGTAVVRFLRQPERAQNKPPSLELTCRDKKKGSAMWFCRDGACEPTLHLYLPPHSRFTQFAPDRFGAHWSCGFDCRPLLALDRLLSEQTERELGPAARPELLRMQREVAADLAGFITQSCRGDRCNPALLTAGRELERLATRPGVELQLVTILRQPDEVRARDIEYMLDAGDRLKKVLTEPIFFSQIFSKSSAASENDLQLSVYCSFTPHSGRAYTLCNARLERRDTTAAGDAGWQRVITAEVTTQSPHVRIVYIGTTGQLGLYPAFPDSDLPMQLEISADALPGPALLPADRIALPAVVAPPTLGRIAFATHWPETRLCEEFAKLTFHYSEGTSGLEWHGQGAAALHRVFAEPKPAAPADPAEGGAEFYASAAGREAFLRFHRTYEQTLTPAEGDSRALATLTTATLTRAAGATTGPKLATLDLTLQCQKPLRADVEFSCRAGKCQTTAQRDFPVASPVGGSYLGDRGWDCTFGSHCPHHKDLELLTKAKPEAVQGEHAELTLRLARDVLSELVAILEKGCADFCTSGVREAASTARQLLTTGLQIESVRARARRGDDEADTSDARISGFVAQLRPALAAATPAAAKLADLRWVLVCRHEKQSLGALGFNLLSRCEATLHAGSQRLLRYLPSFEDPDGRNGPQDLQSYDQLVQLGVRRAPSGATAAEGEMTVHTGFAYTPDRTGMGSVDRWEKGDVSGSIRVGGSALRTH